EFFLRSSLNGCRGGRPTCQPTRKSVSRKVRRCATDKEVRMRINQNIMAFNAYRNIQTTNTQLGKSLEKLSSGYRINRAADDAAGLVKSESLRAEIRGTQQAIRNAQDGVSWVQT